MERLRKKIKMMSINQIVIYHTLLEAFNIIRNSSSENIKKKWTDKPESNYLFRSESNNDLVIPKKPKKKCLGFSYSGSKLYNKLPRYIKESKTPRIFKELITNWIWEEIPSY